MFLKMKDLKSSSSERPNWTNELNLEFIPSLNWLWTGKQLCNDWGAAWSLIGAGDQFRSGGTLWSFGGWSQIMAMHEIQYFQNQDHSHLYNSFMFTINLSWILCKIAQELPLNHNTSSCMWILKYVWNIMLLMCLYFFLMFTHAWTFVFLVYIAHSEIHCQTNPCLG